MDGAVTGREPYDLARVVDPEGLGKSEAGDIDGGEAAVGIEETMGAAADVPPYDLAAIVDPVCGGVKPAGDINRSEARAAFEKAVARLPYGILEKTHDLASIVDPVSGGSNRAGDIKRAEVVHGRRPTSSGHTDEQTDGTETSDDLKPRHCCLLPRRPGLRK